MHINSKQFYDIYTRISKKTITYLSNPQILYNIIHTNKPTVFPAFMMLYSISSEKSLHKLKLSLRDFLLTQTSSQQTINWWQRNSQQEKLEPYPDDLDDTFCTWSSIQKTFPESVTANILATLTKVLIQHEKEEGGPYTTWVVPTYIKDKNKWCDTDPVVHTNIAFFLSQHDIYLEKVIQYIKHSYQHQFSSAYYSSIFPILYFYSRFYENYHIFCKTHKKNNVLRNISRKAIFALQTYVKHQKHLDLQDTALCICILSNLTQNTTTSPLILKLLIHMNTLIAKGFTKGNICIHTNKHGIIKTEGSTYVTAALCIEALNVFRLHTKIQKSKKTQTLIKTSEQATLSILKDLPENNEDTIILFTKLKTSNSFRFSTTLPLHVFKVLCKEKYICSKDVIEKLLIATMLGWISFTIEDNIIDKDMDKQNWKKTQDVLFQKSLNLFKNATKDDISFTKKLTHVLFKMEKTKKPFVINTNVLSEKKYMKYSIDKSLGCLLPTFGILRFIKDIKKREFIERYIVQYYKHMMFIYQLSDDAHDFEEDIRQEKQTLATSLIKQHVCSNKKEVHMYFWTHDIFIITSMMRKHLKKAQKALIFLDVDTQLFIEETVKIEKMIDTTIQEAIHIKDFLSSYKKNGMLNSTHG